MKFSLKANWEILLVLVIIAVGIVIITVAAIRRGKLFRRKAMAAKVLAFILICQFDAFRLLIACNIANNSTLTHKKSV